MRTKHGIFGKRRLAAALIVLAAAATAAQAGPRLKLSQRAWDFGQIWHGDPCTINIEFSNVGDEPLHILGVKSTCGCATGTSNKAVLQPGERDTLKITYDTTKNDKVVKQTITIKTSDEIEPEMKIIIRGEVWNVFDCEPRTGISFGKVVSTTEKSGEIVLTSNMPDKVSPKLAPLPDDAPFAVRLEEIEAGKKYRLVVATKPPLKLGNNHVFVILETGVERLPTMQIGVSARVFDKVAIWPDKLRVIETQVKPGTRTLHLYYSEDHPTRITDVKANFDGISVQLLGDQPTNSMSVFPSRQLRVTLPPFADFPEKGAKLEIHTDHPDPKFQILEVPIGKVDRSKQSKP